MFDELRASCVRDLRQLHTVGSSSQDRIREILDNQGSLNRRVSDLENDWATQGTDLICIEQLEGARQVIQHLVEDLSQRIEYVEGLLDRLWEDSLGNLRLFHRVTERIEGFQEDRDERLWMALERLEAAEEQRRAESIDLQARMFDLASRNQDLEGKVLHLEGSYVTLTDQVRCGIRNFLVVPNSLT